MIKEVIVVEGKQDAAALKRAEIEAEVIATGGFRLAPHTLKQIGQAYEKRGIIILTDPDSAGERIRKFLSERFPQAKHAFVPRSEATANNDVGIEQASPAAIRSALAKVRYQEWRPRNEFSLQDIVENRLTGVPEAADRRAIVGEKLGIGYANAKQFLYRLNNYGVKRDEFALAVSQMEEELCSRQLPNAR